MDVPAEMYSTGAAAKLVSNFDNEIYPDINAFLTGSSPSQRGLSSAVLQKYKVGVGRERFTDENGHMCDFDAIYFPLFAPRMGKDQKE